MLKWEGAPQAASAGGWRARGGGGGDNEDGPTMTTTTSHLNHTARDAARYGFIHITPRRALYAVSWSCTARWWCGWWRLW